VSLTRSGETLLRRLLSGGTLLLLAGALMLLAMAVLQPPTARDVDVSIKQYEASDKAESEVPPKVKALISTRMSRSIVAKPVENKSAPAPELSTLIRVKGILDYGNPKENEALIEIIKTNQTMSCKTGDAVQGVSAVIVLIDSAVTFRYEGKLCRLGTSSGEAESSSLPFAGRDAPVLSDGQTQIPGPADRNANK
jgi:hypothetical protein